MRKATTSAMDYWIIKGNKKYPTDWDDRYGNLSDMLETGHEGVWATRRKIPEDFKKGDGIFYWSSAPDCFVIGLGKVLDPNLSNGGEYNQFKLSYLTPPLRRTHTINDLRRLLPKSPNGNLASFLRPACVQTIYSLTHDQAVRLAKLIAQPTQEVEVARETARDRLRSWRLIEAVS